MSAFTLAGYPLIGGRIRMPLSGPWLATLNVDSDEVLQGSVALELPGVTLQCTVLPGKAGGGIVEGINWCRLVGGAAGLRQQVKGQHYYYADARTIAQHILQEVGETLSPTSTDPQLSSTMDHWMRMGGTAGRAIDVLAEQLSLEWRVLPDGTVWLGQSSWEVSIIPADIMKESLIQGRLELAADDQTAMRGTTLQVQDAQSLRIEEGSWRVISVDHFLSEGAIWRSIAQYEEGDAAR
jgi:hypothetical protein